MFKILPKYPYISEELLDRCNQKNDYTEYLFETFKHIGKCVLTIAEIQPESHSLKKFNKIQYAIYTGLLNRCSRLMLSYIELSYQGIFGETTSILDRCICETLVRLMWLTREDQIERANRFIADSLKKDLEFKQLIIDDADNQRYQTNIGKELIKTIDKFVSDSEISEEEVAKTNNLPKFNQMIKSIQMPDRYYQLIQKQRSHSVHGSWTDLLRNYLRKDANGNFTLRDHGIKTKAEQFLFLIDMVIMTIVNYLKYIIKDPSEHFSVDAYFQPIVDKLITIRDLQFKYDNTPIRSE